MPITPMPMQSSGASAGSPAMPDYSAIIGQLMGGPPPSSMGMFGGNPTQAFGKMTDYANQANYQRGQGILGLLSKQGASSKADNLDIFNQEKAGIDQSMMNKGLANMTVGDNLKAGATRDYARANSTVDERVAGNLANMANSFTQKAPDMGVFASLMQGANRGGGGMISSGGNAPGMGTILNNPVGRMFAF